MNQLTKAGMDRIKKQLLRDVKDDDEIGKEKVNRYLNLLSIFYQLDESIKEKGVMVETVNASQRFLKPNPAIAEKSKVNASLIALSRDLNASPPSGGDKKSDSGYSASDLV